jgi:uncharacterized protein
MLTVEQILANTDHRPWPLPTGPWVMFQQWSDLLFAHWAVDPVLIRHLVPEQLELDLFDGKAWVSVTPFRMTQLNMRGLPPIPGTSNFLEMNLRTYVRQRYAGVAATHPAPGRDPADWVEKPGVYFFSLDCTNLPAVMGARLGVGLPYFWAEMSAEKHTDIMHYKSERRQVNADVEVKYKTNGDSIVAKTELERFLTERYCLYEIRAGVVMRTEIHHIEWPLHRTETTFVKNNVGLPFGIPLTLKPDKVQFCRQLDVLVYPPEVAM